MFTIILQLLIRALLVTFKDILNLKKKLNFFKNFNTKSNNKKKLKGRKFQILNKINKNFNNKPKSKIKHFYGKKKVQKYKT